MYAGLILVHGRPLRIPCRGPRNDAIYVNGDAACSEFRWDFRGKLRKDSSAIMTHGVETQSYRKENGQWRIVHVHYSEDPKPTS